MADDKLWHENEGTITLWMPEPDTLTLAIVGKLGEEAAELAGRCHRVVIQGLHERDPKTGHTNKAELHREIADVTAAIEWARERFFLTDMVEDGQLTDRARRKLAGYRTWQNLIMQELVRQGKA